MIAGWSPTERLDLLAGYARGVTCLSFQRTCYWVRSREYPNMMRFSAFAALLSGTPSHQVFDRQMLIAEVFSRETVQTLHVAGVGFSVMCGLASTHWQLRPPLVEIAKTGATTRGLEYARRAGEAHLQKCPEGTGVVEVVKAAYARWQSGQARAEKRKGRASQEEAARLAHWEERLEAREKEVEKREEYVLQKLVKLSGQSQG